jgi:polar amino acid transport system permease protein
LGYSLALLWRHAEGFAETTALAVALAIAATLASWAFGLMLALMRRSAWRGPRGLAWAAIGFLRGTPTLILIFLVYFGLPTTGLRLDPYTAGILALGLNSGAFVAEILRGGFLAVPRGQTEAARALGLRPWALMRRVILPQVLRVALPPLTNEAVTLLKNTSLLSTITVFELTLFAQTAIARTFRPFEFYIATALIYLALSALVAWGARCLERRLSLP